MSTVNSNQDGNLPLPDAQRPASAPRHLIVGIGASAGGMQALTQFLEQMPDRSGTSFVLVMHLSPSHPSHAREILQRSTAMPVLEVTEAMLLEPDHVYVIPPGRVLSMDRTHLHLKEQIRPRGGSVTIDTFFRNLAEAQEACAAAVVLSGTGTDGAMGLLRIKEMGGVSFAQQPSEAEHPGMPQAAIATGMVDFVLPVAQIAARLHQLSQNLPQIGVPLDAPALARPPSLDSPAEQQAERALGEIMSMLRSRTKHDFRHYKRPTVLRRLERRMQVTGTRDLQGYRDHLAAHTEETSALLQDMLISVTHFFRDEDAFDALERDVLPGLQATVETDRGLRAWVVGCATGEEAYSVAMLLQEAQTREGHHAPFQIFASDIDDRALGVARQGSYPEAIAVDLKPARLRNFCLREGNQFRIVRNLREQVLFAHHNVLRDPPFSRVDLICCRNLLIYLDQPAQAEVMEILRFALRPGGVLFLGSSETADCSNDGFLAIDKRHRLYRRAGGGRSPRLLVADSSEAAAPREPVSSATAARARLPIHAEMHQRALVAWAPPSVLIDSRNEILHVSEGASQFLQVRSGPASLSLLDTVKPELQLDLRTALFRARPVGADRAAPVVTRCESPDGPVTMTVQPLQIEDGEDAMLVVFQRTKEPDHAAAIRNRSNGDADVTPHPLDAEQKRLQAHLQEVIEHSEASTEELMSSNEELQSVNEELRSATEELETSREELQSTNEELTTVNVQLAMKVEETSRINDDLQNLINSHDIGTVFVDSAMRIKRYTPRALDLFNLIPADVGRLLTDITHRLDYPNLVQDAHATFQTLRLVEREVRGNDGRQYVARMLPYRTADDKIEGAILAFVDVTVLRRSQSALRLSAERLRLAAESTRDFAIATTDPAGLVTGWNRGAERLFGYTEAEMLCQSMSMLFTQDDRAAGAFEAELAMARSEGRVDDDRWFRRKDGSVFFASGVTSVLDGDVGFAKIARDLTGSQQAGLARERKLTRETAGRREAEAMIEAKEMFLAVMSHELKHPLNLIHVNAELLARMPEIREIATASRAAGIIQKTVASQARIIDDLLDLSRARTGKLRLDPEPVDWGALVRRIVDAMQPQAQAKNVRLTAEVVDPSPLALFDAVRAEQVAWNLLSNGLKFTPEGGAVHVTLDTEGEAMRLRVRDNGRGIAPAFIDSMFDMFSQEESLGVVADRKGRGERSDGDSGAATGLGIGLALVRELVQAHNGRVQARSEGLGRGSCGRDQSPAPAAARR
ncbi:MAG: chemotaxis protein CheB [Rubrivivax sp.]